MTFGGRVLCQLSRRTTAQRTTTRLRVATWLNLRRRNRPTRESVSSSTLWWPPDASKVVSPKCSGHIALRRTDGFLCEKLRLVRDRMCISRRQHQVLKSVSSPPGRIRGGAGLEGRTQQSNSPNDAASGTSEGMGVMVPPILWDEDCQHRACPVYPWSQVPDPRPY